MTEKSSEPGRRVKLHNPTEASQNFAEWLLVHTIDDMEARTMHGHGRYEVLGLAPLLRRALLDEAPVVHLSRKRLRLKEPRFECTPFVPTPQPPVVPGVRWVPLLGFAGLDFAEGSQGFGIEKFLASPIGQFRNDPVTVRQLIQYFSHVHGGVHIGKPLSEREAVLQSVASAIDEAAAAWMQSLVAIAVVTIRALRPLQLRLEENRPDIRD